MSAVARPLAEPVARGRFAWVAFAVAPVGVLTAWTIMRLGASRGPGSGWVLAHSVWLVSYLLFGVIVAELYRRSPHGGRAVTVLSAATAVAGIATIAGQMSVDVVIGLIASDRARMDELYERVFDVPGVRVSLYQLGPVLLIVGLAAQVVQLAVTRVASRRTAVLALAGIALIGAEGAAGGVVRLVVMPVGAGCLWLALNVLSRASA